MRKILFAAILLAGCWAGGKELSAAVKPAIRARENFHAALLTNDKTKKCMLLLAALEDAPDSDLYFQELSNCSPGFPLRIKAGERLLKLAAKHPRSRFVILGGYWNRFVNMDRQEIIDLMDLVLGNIPADNVPLALNTMLPNDIRVIKAEYVDDSFNSRFSAHSKTYMYRAYCGKIISPFYRNYAYHFPYDVDVDKIKESLPHFEGTHDFAGFMTQGSSQKTTIRTVNFLRAKKDNDLLTFEINADAYLYNMVRIISGTLLYVGIGRISPFEIPDIIQSLDRKRAGITAGAQGLFLKEVLY